MTTGYYEKLILINQSDCFDEKRKNSFNWISNLEFGFGEKMCGEYLNWCKKYPETPEVEAGRGACALPPSSGISVNPIRVKGGADYAHHITNVPQSIWTMRRLWLSIWIQFLFDPIVCICRRRDTRRHKSLTSPFPLFLHFSKIALL